MQSKKNQQMGSALAAAISFGCIGWHVMAGASGDRDSLIVPGKSIGHVRLGGYMGPIYKRLGSPASSDAAAGTLMDKWESGKYRVVVRSHWGGPQDHLRVITAVSVNSPYFRTRDGIGVGSAWTQIHRRFPTLQSDGATLTPDGVEQIYADNRLGLSFIVRRARDTRPTEGRCIEVEVYTPSKD